jgi:hypothetical protein
MLSDHGLHTGETHAGETPAARQTTPAAPKPSRLIHPEGLRKISIAEAVELDRKLSGDTRTIIEQHEVGKFAMQVTLDGNSPDWLKQFLTENHKAVAGYVSEERGRIIFNPADGKHYREREYRMPDDAAIEAALIRCDAHPYRRRKGPKKAQSVKMLRRFYITIVNSFGTFNVSRDWRGARIERQKKALADILARAPAETLADIKMKLELAESFVLFGDHQSGRIAVKVSMEAMKPYWAAPGDGRSIHLRKAA